MEDLRDVSCWHACSESRRLLPTRFRSGTSMTASPDFATYLQGHDRVDTWARDVKGRLIDNAKNQIRAGYPVILFGTFPTGNNKKGAHAVVAYGETTGGVYITHYGWQGRTNILLNSGIIGSNTKFRLT